MKSIIINGQNLSVFCLIFIFLFAGLAFASNRANANFIYDYGKMLETEFHSENADFNAKILFQNPLAFNWNSTSIESDGGKVALLSATFPFNINSFILEPSFLFATGVWQSGSFDYFYGKPNLPSVFGFSMYFNHYSNALGMHYIFGNAKILNNAETAELFNSDFYIYNAFYKFGFTENLNLYAGFAGLNAEASGALTAENQGYFLFPYLFYNASGYMNAKAIYGIANINFNTRVVEYGIDFGALAALDGKIAGNMRYKYRKFYGTEEIDENLNTVQMKNNGVAFSILSVKTKKINIGKNYIQYGIQKPLAIPFGKIFSSINSSENSDYLKDALLWGLTANISIYF